jgi:hypothetical protein
MRPLGLAFGHRQGLDQSSEFPHPPQIEYYQWSTTELKQENLPAMADIDSHCQVST